LKLLELNSEVFEFSQMMRLLGQYISKYVVGLFWNQTQKFANISFYKRSHGCKWKEK